MEISGSTLLPEGQIFRYSFLFLFVGYTAELCIICVHEI
jgi:hypothetical protein